MKLLIIALGIAGAAALAAPAQAQNYPWCAQYGGSAGSPTNCGFSNFRQCQADISGIGGFCVRNNTYRPPGGPHHRIRAQ
ncbi:MAG: DUF3551 domain-containing protein [Xanthobacteraceae bacterium]